MSTPLLRRSAFLLGMALLGMAGVVLVVGAGAPAEAATLFTPPFSAPFGGSALCTVVNVSDTPRSVEIEMLTFSGAPVPSASCSAVNGEAVTVNAGAVSAIACTGNGYRYCRFTVSGGKTAIRGALRVFDADDATLGVLPAE